MNRFELFIILMLVSILGTAAFVVIGAVSDTAAAPCEAPAEGWKPPNLRLCPEDMTLWNCIRNASYRSDL